MSRTCGSCRRFLEFCCDYGVCVPEAMQAVAHMSAEQAVYEVFENVEHRDAQEDTCADYLAGGNER